jgi:hypothetical protein
MSEQPKKPSPPPQSRVVQICVLLGVVAGVCSMQFIIGPTYFPPPEGGGFNYQRVLAAGVVGAVCAVIGGVIGKGIELMVKK